VALADWRYEFWRCGKVVEFLVGRRWDTVLLFDVDKEGGVEVELDEFDAVERTEGEYREPTTAHGDIVFAEGVEEGFVATQGFCY
jgi:hypothetical protein